MKKVLSILVLLSLILGCKPNQTGGQEKKEANSFVLKTILDNFLVENPELTNNEITLKEGSEKLEMLLRVKLNDSFEVISELPFEFEAAVEYPASPFESVEIEAFANAGKYVAKFGFGEYTSKVKLANNYKTTFQVFSIMDKETVMKLKKGSLYKINGVFKDFANCKGSFYLPGGKCFDNPPKIDSHKEGPYINLGTLIVEDISFVEIGE